MTLLERLGGPEAIIQGILSEFRGLNQFPHGSRNEKAQSDYFMQRLTSMGLSPLQDGAGNVMADVPATPGREGCPRLILQGHMDMVCSVRPGSGFDAQLDPPRLVVEDGVLRTDGTSSLGADNNLGNATVLWLLEQEIVHGPLRLLFTVREEIGLRGARQVDPAWLADAYGLLNTDGFHLGRAVVSSSGGRRATYIHPLLTLPPSGQEAFRLTITGGSGGHSGDDIHRGRMNAVQELAGFLTELGVETLYEMTDLSGGSAHNAIPAQAGVTLVFPRGRMEYLRDRTERLQTDLMRWYGQSETNVRVELFPTPLPETVWSGVCVAHTCTLLTGLFNGVYAMHPAFQDVVGASANVGGVYSEAGTIRVRAFIRCAEKDLEERLFAQHDSAAEQTGFTPADITSYPSWPGHPDSRLVRTLCDVYHRETGREMEVTAVHVGLEPSVLGEKNPRMVMVSTGPEILDAHSVDERAPLEGLPTYAVILAGTLESI